MRRLRRPLGGGIGSLGLSVGGYAVHQLGDRVFLDGFLSVGRGRNALSLSDQVLTLEGRYSTTSVAMGGTLRAVFDGPGFEFLPELSVSYGRTRIGGIVLDGSAFGMTASGLQVDAGEVSLASLLLRPEVRVPLDGLAVAESLSLLSYAPRLLCERIRAGASDGECGVGAELGYDWQSSDGTGGLSARMATDRPGGRSGTTVQLNMVRRF